MSYRTGWQALLTGVERKRMFGDRIAKNACKIVGIQLKDFIFAPGFEIREKQRHGNKMETA
jgi:hypothetical protein